MSLTTRNEDSVLDLTGTAESIEQSHIGSGARSARIDHLIMLMMCFFATSHQNCHFQAKMRHGFFAVHSSDCAHRIK